MATLFAQHALLPDGWARDVSIDVTDGHIERVLPNSDRDADAERIGIALPGPLQCAQSRVSARDARPH